MVKGLIMNSAGNGWLAFLFPPACVLCGEALGVVYQHRPHVQPAVAQRLCEGCYGDLPFNRHACSRCAIPLPANYVSKNPQHRVCADCLQQSPPFQHSLSAFVYGQPLEWMLQQFKFNAQLMYAPLLAGLWLDYRRAQSALDVLPEALLPMPLHRARLRQRGFNQSLMLASYLSKALQIPLNTQHAQRIHDTPHQTGRSAQQRRRNMKGAFHFENAHHYRHLAIVDDVVTTGSSVSELTRQLKRAGVQRVDVWSLARAEKNR
jgi:ComF family protein